jgi:hypothetical protein
MLLVLHCLFHGDDPSHIFGVKLDDSEMVWALRDAIKDKKKHRLSHVDADAIDIFKVSFGRDDLDTKLRHFQPKDDRAKGVHHLVEAMERLKQLFENPADNHVHVIVWQPSDGEHSLVLRIIPSVSCARFVSFIDTVSFT